MIVLFQALVLVWECLVPLPFHQASILIWDLVMLHQEEVLRKNWINNLILHPLFSTTYTTTFRRIILYIFVGIHSQNLEFEPQKKIHF